MSVPHVIPILWGDIYAQNPETVQNIHDMVSDLVTGPYMNGMAQYGIMRGSVQTPIVVNDPNPPGTIIYYDSNNHLQDDITRNLQSWIGAGLVPPVSQSDYATQLPRPNALDDLFGNCGSNDFLPERPGTGMVRRRDIATSSKQ